MVLSAGPFGVISFVTPSSRSHTLQKDAAGMTGILLKFEGRLQVRLGVSAWSDFTVTTMLSSFLHFLAIELAEESAICHGI